jgi:uncharacterized protein (TIGR02246 family)
MKSQSNFRLLAASVTLVFCSIACNSPKSETVTNAVETPVKPDMAAIKAEIQAIENIYAEATNAQDAKTIIDLYADDAVSVQSYKPDMLVGKAAIGKYIEAEAAKAPKGQTAIFETLDVFGDGNIVTELGKTTVKDASGKVTYGGKYMAIWEKRNGKYLCIRDIYSADAKPK